jgi:glycosyltransferase involved in cell wall biosynthesis
VRLYAWLHAPDAPVVVIPNGVDPVRFRPDPGARAATPVVGFAGRLSRDKGIDTILELAPRINCAIELVGRDFRGYRNARIPNVAVLPETDRPEDYYRRWWAFLSASPREGFGLAIAEALSSGCPPVMLRSGGITAYLRHGRDALIADSPAELVRHVDDVVEKRVALAPAAFRFSADDMARRYLELYRGPGPGRRPVSGPRAPTFRVRSDRPRVPGGALGVAPGGWYGVVRALAGLCDAHAEPEVAIDAIDAHRPRVVVLGCFQEEWIPVCRHAHRRGATVVATWHAAYVLNEFDEVNRRRMAALLDAYRAGDVDHLATPHRALAASWTHYGVPTDYLPNLVDQGLRRQDRLPGINIGILGSGQSWKNLECQIVAAGMIPGATIHVQSRQGLPVVARLGLRVRRHLATLPDERYHALVGGMTVNLCVSLSESYSYLTAESFLMETPVLTSSTAPLVRAAGADESLVSLCGTPHFDDPVAITDGITRLIERRDVLGPRLREHMLAVDRANREICARVVRGWT